MASDLRLPVVGQHLAVALEVVPAGKVESVPLQVDAELARSGVEHAQPLGHDLFANAVAGDDGNAVFRHDLLQKQ